MMQPRQSEEVTEPEAEVFADADTCRNVILFIIDPGVGNSCLTGSLS